MHLLDIQNLRTTFDIHVGSVKAVRGVTMHVDKGEAVGIVGESGSGKSVTMLSVMRLLPDYAKITADRLMFDNIDLLKAKPNVLRGLEGNRIGMVFQDPMTSLNPLFTVGHQLLEPLRIHQRLGSVKARARALELLRLVDMPDPESRLKQYPHELSGGMRQRVMIAMAIACQPELLIADEPTTALDVTIQAQVLELLAGLQESLGLSVLLITHDLGVVAGLCDRVAVMYAGQIIETGRAEDVFERPSHPYTQGLIRSTPRLDDHMERLIAIDGAPPNLLNPPPGCAFRDRCPIAEPRCETPPMLGPSWPEGTVACWRASTDAWASDVEAPGMRRVV